jgi:hypothetical protein
MKINLAENLLRFAPKNLDAKTIEKIQELAEQTATTSNIPANVAQIPNWKTVATWFKTNAHDKGIKTAALAYGDFLYQAEPAGQDFRLSVYQAQQCQYGTFPFIALQRYADLSTDGMGNIKDAETTPMQALVSLQNVSNQVSAGIQEVNDNWNNSIPQTNTAVARQHIKLRKPALQNTINVIKQQSNLAEIGSKLTGTAKGAYEEIIS